MATTKDTPSNSEAYYAHKLAAIERRRRFRKKLKQIFEACVACTLICAFAWLAYAAVHCFIIEPIEDHNDWVEKVDRDLAELKARPISCIYIPTITNSVSAVTNLTLTTWR